MKIILGQNGRGSGGRAGAHFYIRPDRFRVHQHVPRNAGGDLRGATCEVPKRTASAVLPAEQPSPGVPKWRDFEIRRDSELRWWPGDAVPPGQYSEYPMDETPC